MNLHRLDLVSLQLFCLVAQGATADYLAPPALGDLARNELARWDEVV